jgi:beta-glucosidase
VSTPALPHTASSFPDGFVWGTATSSYQIEGSVDADGRGPSIWDTFSHTPGAVYNDDTGDHACDHYQKLEGDLDLLAELGAPSYRFSVAWPRIQPTGKGPVHQPGLDFYRRLVAGLRDRGIVPALTLYHWDLPQPLEDAGGWTVRDTADRFAEYAALVAEGLGDEVGMWTTLNEPWCSAWLGYGDGVHAPGRKDIGAAVAATHHLLLAHGLGVEAIRAGVPGEALVGITLNPAPVRAASDHPDDQAVARLTDGNLNRIFLDPLRHGRYPEDMLEHYAGRQPGFSVVADGDLDIISRPIDFLGVNYYFPHMVAARGRASAVTALGLGVSETEAPVHADLGAVSVSRPGWEHTTMGWEVEPAGLTELLVRINADWGPIPMYVTENGGAYGDYVDPDGVVRDRDRIRYLNNHFRAALDAISAGVDLRGYFVWSLLDNFEWARGYHERFGLVWVDFPTSARLPKESFTWYQDVVRTNRLPG